TPHKEKVLKSTIIEGIPIQEDLETILKAIREKK
ncbi:unnamed protein product, partial [marine sediment metagenome]